MPYIRVLFVLLVLLVTSILPTAAQEEEPQPILEQVSITDLQEEEWNLEIIAYFDEDGDNEQDPEEPELWTEGTISWGDKGGVTYVKEWKSQPGNPARFDVYTQSYVEIKVTNANAGWYRCQETNFKMPEEGRWRIRIDCYIPIWMWLPKLLNWH